MIDPYVISLGEKLYLKLFDDPNRPDDYTVQMWAVFLLEKTLNKGE